VNDRRLFPGYRSRRRDTSAALTLPNSDEFSLEA